MHLAVAERDDRPARRQKPRGKVACASATGVIGRGGVEGRAERGAPAVHTEKRESPDVVGRSGPAANCSQVAVAHEAVARRGATGTEGPGRVVPGTPSDPS